MKRIAVVGIGGVGGYFGGRLAERYAASKEIEVVFIARGEHLAKIRENGLAVSTPEGDFTARPDLAVDDPKDAGRFDVVLMCVKRYDLAGSARLVKANLGPESVVISLLNGVDNVEALAPLLPGTRVINGCVYISAFREKPGHIRKAGTTHRLFFGVQSGAAEDLKGIETLFVDAGIDASLSRDIRQVVWEKYLFVSPLASATTYLKQPIGAFVGAGRYRTLLAGLMREVADIGKARGVAISEEMILAAMEKNRLFPYETKTSLQLDVERGGRAEIDLFPGYVVNSGRELNIATPLHEKVYEALTLPAA